MVFPQNVLSCIKSSGGRAEEGERWGKIRIGMRVSHRAADGERL